MSTEAALLGLISVLRATPLAVIYGFLLGPRPVRLLLAYLASGLVVSLPVGIAVVTGFHRAAPTHGAGTIRDAVDLGPRRPDRGSRPAHPSPARAFLAR